MEWRFRHYRILATIAVRSKPYIFLNGFIQHKEEIQIKHTIIHFKNYRALSDDFFS